MSTKPAFEVIRADGHAFRIWADGRTEGFGDASATVINRIPMLLDEVHAAISPRVSGDRFAAGQAAAVARRAFADGGSMRRPADADKWMA